MHWLALSILFLSLSVHAGWRNETKKILHEYDYACKATQVSIDSIVANQHIAGHVSGLPLEAYKKFKVVFYVKTNVWYVHPYAYYQGQEEGYSYANLKSDGTFRIQTLRRAVPAKELAVVLVPQPFKIRDRRWWLNPVLGFLGGILKYECAHTLVPGNGDF
jgi:hypothetical protein